MIITKKLKDISSLIGSGITPRRDTIAFWENGTIPWLKTEQLGEYKIYDTTEKITQLALNETSIKIFPVNTLSIAMYGEGKTRGNVAILKKEMATNQACCNIVIDKEKADFEYVYYFLKTQYNQLRSLSSGVRNNLNSNDIKEFEIRLPNNIPTQQKIASVLSALDSKIELNNIINTELEAMAKTLYDYWFVQFDFPNADRKPYKTSGGKMVWNEELKREIPEGWGVQMLFHGLDVQYGFPFSTSKFTDEVTDKPVIRIRDILENTISTYTTEEVDQKYQLFQKDLLIGMDGNFHMNFWDKDGAYLNQRSVRIRSKKDSNVSNFQAYFELSPYIKAREKNVSRTTVGHLSDKDLKRLFVTSSKKTDNFQPKKTFDSLLSKIITNRLENQQLSELRDWLLPMLMNGQVTSTSSVTGKACYETEEEMRMAAEPEKK